MTLQDRKNLHNKLGGYLTNSHILQSTKEFIQLFQTSNSNVLWEKYIKLPYQEQRKIKMVIYENIPPQLQQILQNKEPNKKYILKKGFAA